jgi:hypothetical protein
MKIVNQEESINTDNVKVHKDLLCLIVLMTEYDTSKQIFMKEIKK